MLGSEGDERVVECDNIDEFMNILEFVRDILDEDTLAYADPLVKNEL